ncbi:MAG: hypothetical protein GX443_18100 [Deltaproteobacteria bacterium]|nr:hypothetical protein [Deltaproteobacteria bacterium]
MDLQPHDYLKLLGQLAREYHEKYKDLESALQSTPDEEVMGHLVFLSQQTTDRFRAAQQSMFALLTVSSETGKDKEMAALTTMCRCFDEIRILFQILAQRQNPPG